MVASVVNQAMGVMNKARPGFELVTQVSGIKSDQPPTKPILYLGNLQEFVNLAYKAAQSNRWQYSTMIFQ